MTFDELMRLYNWKQIKGCPGRYVLKGANKKLSARDLVGIEVKVYEVKTDAARDIVLIVPLDRGGLISYKRKNNNTYLHTLNTPEGMKRKLDQLRIQPDKFHL